MLGGPPGGTEARRALGYMTQSPSVYDDLTVAENLRYFAAIRGSGAGDLRERVQLTLQAHDLVRALRQRLRRALL